MSMGSSAVVGVSATRKFCEPLLPGMFTGWFGEPVRTFVAGSVVWYRKSAAGKLSGAMLQSVASFSPVLIMVANAVAADWRPIACCAIARVESPADRRSRYRFSTGFRSLYSLLSPRFQCEFCDHVGGTVGHPASRGADVKSIHLLPWPSRARVHLEIILPYDIPHDIYHGYRQVHHMTKTAKLFRTGRSKAVRPAAERISLRGF